MPTKIWLKPEQLELYIKQLERFRDLYSQLDQTLENDRQDFQFKAGALNFQSINAILKLDKHNLKHTEMCFFLTKN